MVGRWLTTRFEALMVACGLGYMAFPVGRHFWDYEVTKFGPAAKWIFLDVFPVFVSL